MAFRNAGKGAAVVVLRPTVRIPAFILQELRVLGGRTVAATIAFFGAEADPRAAVPGILLILLGITFTCGRAFVCSHFCPVAMTQLSFEKKDF